MTSGGLLGVWGKWVKHAKYIYNIQDFNPEQVLAVGYTKAKLILGHSYKKYVPDVSVKMPRFKDGFKRTMVNVAFDDAMVHAGWYDQVTTKNSRQIIKDNKSFFDALSDIDTIIVIGHSLSEVDMEYFEKIRSVAHSDAKWIFSCHDSGGLKAVDAFAKMMGISADKVTVFRL